MILNLPLSVRLYVCTEPTDMRKAFDGLAALVEHVLEKDPLSGHLFCFFNRRADHWAEEHPEALRRQRPA